MATTYEAIQTTTLGSASALITFSSIPATYTDLILVLDSIQSAAPAKWCTVQFNSDTGSNYSWTVLAGNGTTASSGRYAYTYLPIGVNTSTNASRQAVITSIMNYSNTTTYKTLLSRANNASLYVEAIVGLWQNTSAINRIDVSLEFGAQTFAVGSTFTLYGILAA